MARATYTEADKARVYVVLTTNEGNVKRTARETGTPENTVRRWKQDWDRYGAPVITDEIVQDAVGDFLNQAERTRWKALMEIDKKLPQAKVSELNVTVGILSDKIDRAKGLALGRVEHVHALPPADEIREALTAMVQGALVAARTRQEEIIDAEFTEEQAIPALPASAE